MFDEIQGAEWLIVGFTALGFVFSMGLICHANYVMWRKKPRIRANRARQSGSTDIEQPEHPMNGHDCEKLWKVGIGLLSRRIDVVWFRMEPTAELAAGRELSIHFWRKKRSG